MELTGKRVVVANWRDPDHSMAGGAERYAWEFARALALAGADVDFLTAREAGQRRRERREGIRLVRAGNRFTFYLRAGAFLLRHRRSIDAVVDAESGIPVFAPLLVERRTPVVLVVHHVHQAQFDLYFPVPLARLGRFLESRAMPAVYRSATTVAVSESTRDQMRQQLGWRGAIGILHNGSNAVTDTPTDPADTVDRIVVLGRLAAHKRVDLVIRAVAALRAVRPALRLDVIGSGPQLAALRDLVGDLAAEKFVTVHGYLDEHHKQQLLAQARLHVCASDVEGWGQVVMEAAGHGVPTVARDVPGLRDSVRHTTTGWLLDESAPDLVAVQARLLVGIQAALEELDDPERRLEVADDCRAWAARFSWSAMHAAAVALVSDGLAARRSTSPPEPADRTSSSTRRTLEKNTRKRAS